MATKKTVLTRIFGDPQTKMLRGLKKKVNQINDLADKYQSMSKVELQAQTEKFKNQLKKDNNQLDNLLPEAFALVREASVRVLKMRHFDVQLIGGMVLHDGNVAEMKTGEGKTLVATLPAYLNALTGKGVHIVTVNDYLAQRDAGWMGQIYHYLGLSTGVIINDASFLYDPEFDNGNHDDDRLRRLRPVTRKEAYAADITYGTNNEFGFDYLRDNMVNDMNLLRQRALHFAIVDEVDSILIDEARTPLIISAPAAENPDSYYQFAKIATRLEPNDYDLEEKHRSVSLSDSGIEKVQRLLGVDNLYSPEHVRLVYHMEQALRAQTLFKRDKDYVVTNNGEVIIVDEFTGRLMQGRRYNEGLHQAIEAKEGVKVLQESMTLATISFQNYFRLYDKLSGMTGTALTEAEEFQQIYSLDVIEIPSNQPLARNDQEDLIFKTEKGKIKALVEAIRGYHETGRPVLIGSSSITKNELIAEALSKAGLPYEILNAKNNEREAAIIEKAGEKGAITLATNMAGRGTDIKINKEIVKLGGLVVLGSERHESRRIDNQLRGRCGRQGDPGETQFYVSTEDDLMRIFQGERVAGLMSKLGIEEDMPIHNKAISKTLEMAQKRVEGFNFDTRKNVVQYDNVINRHRRVVYVMRRKILEGLNIDSEIRRLIEEKVRDLTALPAKYVENFDDNFTNFFAINRQDVEKFANEKNDQKRFKMALEQALNVYQKQEKELTKDVIRRIEREIYLQVLDTLWMQHLENMQHLREGIHWRSVGQRDPLVEYRSESQKLFDSLQQNLRDEVIKIVLSVRKTDLIATDGTEDLDTDLTRLAETAVEKGVNEISHGEKKLDKEFKAVKAVSHKKDLARKKKKKQRQNRKKSRR